MISGRVPKLGFNPRTYIRYDFLAPIPEKAPPSFNPRTYIRYDLINQKNNYKIMVSIHVPI